MYGLSQVNGVHGNLDLTDEVMFTKTVKVKDLQDQSLTTQLGVGDLERGKNDVTTKPFLSGLYLTSCVRTLNVKVSLKTGHRFFLWILVSNFFFLSGSM